MRVAALVVAVLVTGAGLAEEHRPANAVPDRATPTTEIRPKSDEALEAAIGRRLADDPRLHAMKMKVAVRGGAVTLTGSAADIEEKDAAEAAVRSVPGVRAVDDRLVVVEPGEPEPGTSAIPEIPARR